MTLTFEVTAKKDAIELEPGAEGTVTFTVKNVSATAAHGSVLLRTEQVESEAWLSFTENSRSELSLNLEPGATRDLQVSVRPANTAPASREFRFWIVAANSANPQDDWTKSPQAHLRTKAKTEAEWKKFIIPGSIGGAVLIAGIVGLVVGLKSCDKELPGLLAKCDGACIEDFTCAVPHGAPADADLVCLRPNGTSCGEARECAGGFCNPDGCAEAPPPPENRPPEIRGLEVTLNGLEATVSGRATDPDSGDKVERVEIEWGESGPGARITSLPPNGAFTTKHKYKKLGGFILRVLATDGDLNSAPATHAVNLTPPRDGLVAYYGLNGNVLDTSGNSRHAYYRARAYGTDRHGMANKAADLENGVRSGQLGLIAAPALPISSSGLTISFWTRARPQGNNERIVGIGRWLSFYYRGGRVMFGTHPREPRLRTQLTLQAPAPHPSHRWTFYGVTIAKPTGTGRSSVVLYQNTAKRVASTTIPQPTVRNCKFYMGLLPNGNPCTSTEAQEFSQYPGLVDDVRVYSRVLTPGEMELLYREGTERR